MRHLKELSGEDTYSQLNVKAQPSSWLISAKKERILGGNAVNWNLRPAAPVMFSVETKTPISEELELPELGVFAGPSNNLSVFEARVVGCFNGLGVVECAGRNLVEKRGGYRSGGAARRRKGGLTPGHRDADEDDSVTEVEDEELTSDGGDVTPASSPGRRGEGCDFPGDQAAATREAAEKESLRCDNLE